MTSCRLGFARIPIERIHVSQLALGSIGRRPCVTNLPIFLVLLLTPSLVLEHGLLTLALQFQLLCAGIGPVLQFRSLTVSFARCNVVGSVDELVLVLNRASDQIPLCLGPIRVILYSPDFFCRLNFDVPGLYFMVPALTDKFVSSKHYGKKHTGHEDATHSAFPPVRGKLAVIDIGDGLLGQRA